MGKDEDAQVSGPEAAVDYRAVFASLSSPKLVLSPDLVVLDANDAFLASVRRPASAVLGRHVLEAFPARPDREEGSAAEIESLQRVARTGRLEVLGPHRYDVLEHGGDRWEERWWIVTNVPVLDSAGHVTHLVQRAEDVTDIVAVAQGPAPCPAVPVVEEVPAVVEHAMAVSSSLERFGAAFERERAAAIELQDSLLTPPPQVPGLTIGVRYRPAAREVRVGGDWYDAFRTPDGATVVVVGDVTGHDISAAAHMGQLRGTLRAVAYAQDAGPGPALDLADRTALGLHLDATGTVLVARLGEPDGTGARAVTWSSAGHPPPLLRRADGTTALLEGRTGALLGFGFGAPRPEHTTTLRPGDVLLLYTDGLVERRGVRLRESLTALAATVAQLPARGADELLDGVLSALVPHGADDDVAILAVCVQDPAGR
ncbi:SpoIIE family protein phosphatase [Cellulomonas sp.]|uniref:SpoIIE family protein phosphatase n=1 Tax=Cellulomonas sp. TaxID=40001 RepID=UPI0028117F4B|nr:SpoIIE family protein phosphatase [Cellulomonas sp.]